MRLTIESPRARMPESAKMPLWPHQLAMLRRCNQIEQSGSAIGIMSDGPGSGKTFALLSLLLQDKERGAGGTNVVVVPINIYTQWNEAISKFTDLNCGQFVQYEEIMKLYYPMLRENLRLYDVLLTTNIHYYTIATTLMSLKLRVRRVIFDEIDNIAWSVESHLPAEVTWFLSASFKPEQTGVYKCSNVEDVTVLCDPEFVKQSILLDPPKVATILVSNLLIDGVLAGVLEGEQMRSVRALDFRKITETKVAQDEKQLVTLLQGEWRSKLECEKLKDKDLRQLIEEDPENPYTEEEHQECRKRIAVLEKKILRMRQLLAHHGLCAFCLEKPTKPYLVTRCCKLKWCKKCLELWMSAHLNCPMCRAENVIKNVVEMIDKPGEKQAIQTNVLKDKKEALLSVIRRLPKDSKTILFSDYDFVFESISQSLAAEGITFADISGGSIKSTDSTLNAFKEGKIRVLLANSKIFGCGMNLEYTTDVILMHKLDEATETQVVGRAQRPGRTCTLRIWHLLYEAERVPPRTAG